MLKTAILFATNLAVLSAVLAITVYSDLVRKLQPAYQILLIVAVAGFQAGIGKLYDQLGLLRDNYRWRKKAEDLELKAGESSRQLDELQQVVVSFLEHSSVYRERVKDLLRLKEDYLCIVKSSEGLGEVYRQAENKEEFPFAAVLRRLPGAIQPIEHNGLFLIPVASLPGITESNIREYILERIVPEVREERGRFLGRQPKKIADLAEEFSFKYIAFLLRKETIVYDALNRKFNHDFIGFVVNAQTARNYGRMKKELRDLVRTKDLLAEVNWATFADLNPERRAFVEANRTAMSAELVRVNRGRLTDLANLSPEELRDILAPVLGRRITAVKLLNLCAKLVEGARHTVEVLRRNGVSL